MLRADELLIDDGPINREKEAGIGLYPAIDSQDEQESVRSVNLLLLSNTSS